jgi:hypothetical protein
MKEVLMKFVYQPPINDPIEFSTREELAEKLLSRATRDMVNAIECVLLDEKYSSEISSLDPNSTPEAGFYENLLVEYHSLKFSINNITEGG